jgi:UDP-glucose 4-epimerase
VTLAWIVGAGGMLGSALTDGATKRGIRTFRSTQVPWGTSSVAATLRSNAESFAAQAGSGPWVVVWAAGESVVASSGEDTIAEFDALDALLDALDGAPPAGDGAFFLTSSAGGVFAGSENPPFDVDTDPNPISPYGLLKLRQERLVAQRLTGRVPVVIGRFSNLYGPGQKTGKPQGLIPQLCLAIVRRKPLNLYVSMDTVRDYLFVDDAAAMAWAVTLRALTDRTPQPRTVLLGSGQPTTIAEVVATVQGVAHRRVPLAIGTDPSSSRQAVDLRIVPTPIADSDLVLTPLPMGIRRVFDAAVGRAG